MSVEIETRKAVFLDRDGVLCEDTDYVTSFEKLKIFPFSKQAVDLIHQKGYLAIVVTNQSAVARGMMTEETLGQINEHLKKETGVDAVYCCPHLPPDRETIEPYRIICSCRKPSAGMLKQAAIDYGIDLKTSYMAGDRESDMQAGKDAGTKTVYISKDSTKKIDADFRYETILEFTENL